MEGAAVKIDLDRLRELAVDGGNDFHEACTPEVVLLLLDTIRSLMDDDSVFAANQKVAKSAIDSMISARKQRNEAEDSLVRLRGLTFNCPKCSLILRCGDFEVRS